MRPLLIGALAVTVAGLTPAIASAQSYRYSVGDSAVVTTASAGEAQSTVVTPNLKAECPSGRVLVTNDQLRPPQDGTVTGRDVGALGGSDHVSKFGPLPGSASDLTFGTNDHDITALNNGDVILQWGVHMKGALRKKPSWFDSTYHGSFGPGARRGLIAWRSTDCGSTFQPVSRIDPATVGDGSCAYPQPNNPPSATYYNGGSDGQLLHTRLTDNALYITFSCVGFYPDKTKSTFTLSSKPVNKTLVFRSTDEAASWQVVATIPGSIWRLSVEELQPNLVVLGESNALLFAHGGSPAFTVDAAAYPAAPPAQFGWAGSAVPSANISANVWASTLVVRCPGTKNPIIVFPDIVDRGTAKAVKGYRMFFYDRASNQYAEAKAVVPQTRGPLSVVMHLVAIDPGRGPVLLYWYDVNGGAGKASIRARAITGDRQYSKDFSISGSPHSRTDAFALTTPGYWYGDYLTAGGYGAPVFRRPPGLPSSSDFHFFPMWVEPDGSARVTEVVLTQVVPLQTPSIPILTPEFVPVWHEAPAAVNFATRPRIPVPYVRDVDKANTNVPH